MSCERLPRPAKQGLAMTLVYYEVNGMTYGMSCERLPRPDKAGLAMTKGAKLACWRLWYPRLNDLSLLPVEAIGSSD